jgi:predicted DNA-binding transcriptional regulator AlpA
MNITPATDRSAPLAVSATDAAALVGVSRAQWWKLHAAGKVPLPVYLGSRAPRWRVDELRDWLAAGAPNRQTWERTRGNGKTT